MKVLTVRTLLTPPMVMVMDGQQYRVRAAMLHLSGGPITKLDIVWYIPWWFSVSGIIGGRRFRWAR